MNELHKCINEQKDIIMNFETRMMASQQQKTFIDIIGKTATKLKEMEWSKKRMHRESSIQ